MFEKIYKNSIIEKPRFTLLILFILLLSFGYFTKDFQLDASSDTLLLENDPDLKYLREVNSKYGSKDFLVLTYTPQSDLLDSSTIKNLANLKDDLKNLEPIAERYCDSFDHVIVLGTGGSSLGGKTLSALAPLPFFNNPSGFLGRPNLYFLENIVLLELSCTL